LRKAQDGGASRSGESDIVRNVERWPDATKIPERFRQLPRALLERSRRATLAGVPALIAHPDWKTPCPTMVWMHGRTVSKELDPGRYLRWIRSGIAAVALDLPGHGERLDPAFQDRRTTLAMVRQMAGEIDGVVDALAGAEFGDVFDFERMGVGGMSAGGMATLLRLCEPHDFIAAAVEGTTGWLSGLFFPESSGMSGTSPWSVVQDRALVTQLDPMSRVDAMAPLPMLFLHARTDRTVPYERLVPYVDALRASFSRRGSRDALVELKTWENTGAPEEHAGFGVFGNDAKNAQAEFLARALRATSVGEAF
jgi:alpha-beta hydrolase superfamily lysophospholipase